MILNENLVAIAITAILFYLVNKKFQLRVKFKNIQNKSFSYFPILFLLSTILINCFNGNQLLKTMFSMLTLFCFLVVIP
jgi:uncharacterized membrane protein